MFCNSLFQRYIRNLEANLKKKKSNLTCKIGVRSKARAKFTVYLTARGHSPASALIQRRCHESISDSVNARSHSTRAL
jgi:hypothetical protein